MKAVLLYSGHAIAEMSHDNHVRIVCIDTYEEYTVCFTNCVAITFILTKIIIILVGGEWVWLSG